jgi:hypothetical protein
MAHLMFPDLRKHNLLLLSTGVGRPTQLSPEGRWVPSRREVGHRQAPRRRDGGEGVCGAGRRQAIAVRTQCVGIPTEIPLALLGKAATSPERVRSLRLFARHCFGGDVTPRREKLLHRPQVSRGLPPALPQRGACQVLAVSGVPRSLHPAGTSRHSFPPFHPHPPRGRRVSRFFGFSWDSGSLLARPSGSKLAHLTDFA